MELPSPLIWYLCDSRCIIQSFLIRVLPPFLRTQCIKFESDIFWVLRKINTGNFVEEPAIIVMKHLYLPKKELVICISVRKGFHVTFVAEIVAMIAHPYPPHTVSCRVVKITP